MNQLIHLNDGIGLPELANNIVGMRGWALIGRMIYSCARIGATISREVRDVYVQNRRLWAVAREGRQTARNAVSPHAGAISGRL